VFFAVKTGMIQNKARAWKQGLKRPVEPPKTQYSAKILRREFRTSRGARQLPLRACAWRLLPQPCSSTGCRLAAGLPHQDHVHITIDESFRFHNNTFDEMPRKLDSNENLQSLNKYPTPPARATSGGALALEPQRVVGVGPEGPRIDHFIFHFCEIGRLQTSSDVRSQNEETPDLKERVEKGRERGWL